MFFDGSVRSTRRITRSGCSRSRSRSCVEHGRAGGELVELGRVDRDRVRGDDGPPSVVIDGPLLTVDGGAEHRLRRGEEAVPPADGVEADDVVGEQAVVDGAPHLHREHVPVVRLRPGNVDEVGERRLRSRAADEPRCEVQVVVVEQDRRVRSVVELLDDRGREPRVHRRVAVPGGVRLGADARGAREIPEVVLDEPEHRVRDDVVVAVEVGRVVLDEPQAVRNPVAARLVERAAARLGGDGPVLVRDRAGDPGHVVAGDEGRSAVTRPPPPRRAVREPSAARP